jgi:hypothetical protein
MERRSRRRDGEGDLINTQYKPVRNCHNESPLENEYILKKERGNEDENCGYILYLYMKIEE